MYKFFGKRLFDIVASLLGIILLMPLFFLISLWIKLSSKGSVFYKQTRVGKNFQEFSLYKFRSMVTDAHAYGPSVTSGDDPRITKVGKIIRKTKIDELPQLLNVLKGDMSLVGPRPELLKFIEYKREEYKYILSVQPGITDNTAIKFKNEETLLEKYENKEEAYIEIILPQKIDSYRTYIQNISFSYDIHLIFKTLGM